jgi:FkbH-like protein
MNSLRSRAEFNTAKDFAADADAFLREAQAEITFATDKSQDARAFELLNKTNQFNLNGLRLTSAEWTETLADDGRFIVKAAYTDRYGPLGNIAVLVGSAENARVTIHHWVMSCRAFSRRIEHRCMRYLIDRFRADEIVLRFQPTPRNGPTQEFLASLLGSETGGGDVLIPAVLFEKNCPVLYHSIREI